MHGVIDAISTLVKVPVPTHVTKYLLQQEVNIEEISKRFKVSQFVDHITYLVQNKPDMIRYIVKRVYSDNAYPSYFRIDRYFTSNLKERI